jgi:hypothetical protein
LSDDSNDKLKLVAKNDPGHIERQRKRKESDYAAERLEEATRFLAANLLRIIAGAGKAHELVREAAEFISAWENVRNSGHSPSIPIERGLRDLNWQRSNPTTSEETLAYAQRDVAFSSMRWIAAQLAAQVPQERKSEHQLHLAIQNFNDSFVTLKAERDREQ